MDCEDIQKALRRHFINYEYALENSYVFNWESDYFCMSKSCYFVEIEIKVSRGDFIKDFSKPKHKIFFDMVAGKKFSCYQNSFGWNSGDVIIKNFKVPKVIIQGYRSPKPWELKAGAQKDLLSGAAPLVERASWRSGDTGKFIVNDWQDRLVIEYDRFSKDLYAPVSHIGYHNLKEMNIPNQFYYAAPHGLIKPDELPAYAGLLEVGRNCTVTRKAPYIHKRKLDLHRILLKKFYYLWKDSGRHRLFEEQEIKFT